MESRELKSPHRHAAYPDHEVGSVILKNLQQLLFTFGVDAALLIGGATMILFLAQRRSNERLLIYTLATAFFAAVSGAVFAQALGNTVARTMIGPFIANAAEDLDIERLKYAALTGMVVNALVLIAFGKAFQRWNVAKTNAQRFQAVVASVAEAIVSGIAAAAVVGFMRGVLNFEWRLSGEFTVSAVAGSLSARAIFARLDKSMLGKILAEEVKP